MTWKEIEIEVRNLLELSALCFLALQSLAMAENEIKFFVMTLSVWKNKVANFIGRNPEAALNFQKLVIIFYAALGVEASLCPLQILVGSIIFSPLFVANLSQ